MYRARTASFEVVDSQFEDDVEMSQDTEQEARDRNEAAEHATRVPAKEIQKNEEIPNPKPTPASLNDVVNELRHLNKAIKEIQKNEEIPDPKRICLERRQCDNEDESTVAIRAIERWSRGWHLMSDVRGLHLKS